MRRTILPSRLGGVILLGVAAAIVAAIIAAGGAAGLGAKSASAPPDPDTVQLSDAQLGSIKTGEVTERDFPTQKEAVGNIDFNQDMNVQVFTPYQGRIIRTYADLGY